MEEEKKGDTNRVREDEFMAKSKGGNGGKGRKREALT